MYKVTVKKNGLNNEKRSIANLSKRVFIPTTVTMIDTIINTSNYNDDTYSLKSTITARK